MKPIEEEIHTWEFKIPTTKKDGTPDYVTITITAEDIDQAESKLRDFVFEDDSYIEEYPKITPEVFDRFMETCVLDDYRGCYEPVNGEFSYETDKSGGIRTIPFNSAMLSTETINHIKWDLTPIGERGFRTNFLTKPESFYAIANGKNELLSADNENPIWLNEFADDCILYVGKKSHAEKIIEEENLNDVRIILCYDYDGRGSVHHIFEQEK